MNVSCKMLKILWKHFIKSITQSIFPFSLKYRICITTAKYKFESSNSQFRSNILITLLLCYFLFIYLFFLALLSTILFLQGTLRSVFLVFFQLITADTLFLFQPIRFFDWNLRCSLPPFEQARERLQFFLFILIGSLSE